MKEKKQDIDDLIKNRHVPRRGYLTTCCASSKRIAKRPTHITLFDANLDSLKNIRGVLNFVTQTWRRLAGVVIQNAIHRWNIFKGEVIEKPNYYKNHFSP